MREGGWNLWQVGVVLNEPGEFFQQFLFDDSLFNIFRDGTEIAVLFDACLCSLMRCF